MKLQSNDYTCKNDVRREEERGLENEYECWKNDVRKKNGAE